ncbi:hypothetical protein [Halorussus ruber]|uniref:hypothetical protein n=1 Tax=Halorussus ruber TaxID=1126238 RepID=UPI0010920221|nr:hypothetical protein [Halorussus ruber]
MVRAEPYSLWVERVSRWLRFDRISACFLDDESYAPYLFVLTLVFIDVPVLSTIGYLVHEGETVHPLLDYSWWFLVPLGLVVGVIGIRRIRSEFTDAVEKVGQGDGNIRVSTPRRFRCALFVFALVLYYGIIAQNLPQLLLSEGKIIGAVKWVVLIPAGYVTIIVELFSVYVHGLLFLPLAIDRRDVPLDFSDPKKLGGMEPVGSLLLTGTNFYFLGLTLWTGTTVLGPLTGIYGATNSAPGRESIAFFVVAWFTGIFLFLFSLYIVGKNTRRRKEAEISRTIREIQRCGRGPTAFTGNGFDTEKGTAECVRLYVYLDWIDQTETYPVDVEKMWTMFGSIVLPVSLKLLPFVV